MSNRIGLLLPRSVMYPTMSFDMMAGLRNGLAVLGIKDVEIKTENAGLGAEPKDIYAACEKLIFDDCNVVVGYVNPAAADSVGQLFESAGGLFIALDAGFHYTVNGLKAKSNVFTVSLDGALCGRIIARKAINDGYRKFSLAGSFYEAGYRGMHGFYRVIEENNGTITFNHITKLKKAEFTLDPLAEHVLAEQPDCILASFCGDMLQDFYNGMAAGNLFAETPVYGNPFMADEIWLSQCPYPGVDIQVAVPWGSSLINDGNSLFKQTLAANKQRSNIWSLLTWEASRLAAVALMYDDVSAGIAALEQLTFDGPRGKMTIDAATHRANGPVYFGMVTKSDTSKCQLEITDLSPYTDEQRTKLEEDINNFDGQATSWKNAYGCLES